MSKISITGIYESRLPIYLREKVNKNGKDIIVVANGNRVQRLASDLSFFVDKNIYCYFDDEDKLIFYEARNREKAHEKMGVVKSILEEDNWILITDGISAIECLPPRKAIVKNKIIFKVGEEIDVDAVKKRFLNMGYERVPMIFAKGQYSIRGSILDIFPTHEENPYRVELFDTVIESVRTFDVDTQVSIERRREISVYCVAPIVYGKDELNRFIKIVDENYRNLPKRREELKKYGNDRENLSQLEFYIGYFYERTENILDYVCVEDNAVNFYIEDLDRIKDVFEFNRRDYSENFKKILKDGKVVKKDFENVCDFRQFKNRIQKLNCTIFSPFNHCDSGGDNSLFIGEIDEKIEERVTDVLNFHGDFKLLSKEVRKYIRAEYKKIEIICSNEDRIETVKEVLKKAQLTENVVFSEGNLSKGADFLDAKEVFITEFEIFGIAKTPKKIGKRFRNTQAIRNFSDIKNGDYVVHENHGVGKYLGIVQMETLGIKRDFIHIKYAGEDALYVPVEHMELVQKYVGRDGIEPKVYKLSGSDWRNTKDRARKAVLEMAREIVEISAVRKAEKGFGFSKDTKWQKDFEDSFPYEETEDQLRCIREIKEDMEKDEPMDRLLCGDVGYGKTEVAARAMFKCVMDGKQVAMLVPTTLLANQHYNTLKKRFEAFPVTVEMLSRFRTPKEQEKIIKEMKEGKIDIVIGTHRLFSKDMGYRDLGLLVIDEEQRFGVVHKENIKRLKENVDVLTLSATPIPRTLHMSIIGIRKMSVIEEPPQDRVPIQTYVVEEDDKVIREAVEREMARKGQVFVIFNRVRGIRSLEERIKKLIPDVRVAVAHGQMSERALENIMMDFVDGKIQVLIATTIVESGIDVPNANTEIIIDADKYGVSQLYQIRGRVGRSNKVAYAYLMHKREKIMSEVAEKRLKAIKEFTEFGAGFKIAMRDLELRGAGNILGSEQHGHILNVGYELYTKMVAEAVAAIKGTTIKEDLEEIIIDIRVPSYIPNSYIREESVKFDAYKSISQVRNKDEEKEIISEFEDRFGNIPKEVVNLIKVAQIRHLCRSLEIKKISENGNEILIRYSKKGIRPIKMYRSEHSILDDLLMLLRDMNRLNEDENDI